MPPGGGPPQLEFAPEQFPTINDHGPRRRFLVSKLVQNLPGGKLANGAYFCHGFWNQIERIVKDRDAEINMRTSPIKRDCSENSEGGYKNCLEEIVSRFLKKAADQGRNRSDWNDTSALVYSAYVRL